MKIMKHENRHTPVYPGYPFLSWITRTSRVMTVMVAVSILTACTGPHSTETPETTEMASKQQSLLRIAEATRAAGDIPSTIDLYKQIIRDDASGINGHLKLAELYLLMNQDESAIKTLKAAQKRQTNNSQIAALLAKAHIAENQPARALTVLQPALAQQNVDNRLALLNYQGIAFDMTGEHKQAQDSFNRAMRLAPPDAINLPNNLAMSYLLSSEYEQAAKIWEDLLAAGHDNATLRQNLALAYGMLGKDDEARALGVTDLTTEQAEENIQFIQHYRQLGTDSD
jgi:Flp pilus assembly protein TadD